MKNEKVAKGRIIGLTGPCLDDSSTLRPVSLSLGPTLKVIRQNALEKIA